MKQIDMIATRYEWNCPFCETLNSEIGIVYQHQIRKEEVCCEKCDKVFEVRDYYHAYE